MSIVKKAALVLIVVACFATFSYADTIYLKNGKTVEGKIVERTDSYVKVDFMGSVLTYWTNDIERIEEDTDKNMSPSQYYDSGVSDIEKQKYSEGVDMWVKAARLDKTGSMKNKIEDTIKKYIQGASTGNLTLEFTDSSQPWIVIPPLEISHKKIFESLRLEFVTKLQAEGKLNYIYYRNMSAINYFYRGDFDRSLENAKKALSLIAEDNNLTEKEKQQQRGYMLRVIGDIYLHKLDFYNAGENYEQALKITPSDLDALCGLAVVYTVKGDFDKARELYGKVLDSDPKSTFAQDALKRLENAPPKPGGD